MKIRNSIKLFFFVAIASGTLSVFANTTVHLVHAPAGSNVPDVIMDKDGVLHMVYAQNQNAYYIRSSDNGTTFSSPVRVNSSGTVEYKMGERGPKLAVGDDGVIHVAWMDHWSAGVNVYARYTRSLDGGNTFENLKTVSATSGVDGVTVAADGNSHVVLFWHTMVPLQTQVPQATWIHFSRSADNGISFSADTNVMINNHNGLACSMCMTRARFGIDGNVYLAFRSAQNSIRDFYVLKGNPAGNNFTAVRVNNDNWNINYCPMVGPELEADNTGRQFCAFMSNYHVYWAISDPGVNAFTQHVATPLNEQDEIFPTAIPNNAGQVLFLWQVGPMSVTDSAVVKWAVYDTNGTYTGQQGIAGKTSSGTKATAFTGTDGNFYIVINTDFIASTGDDPALLTISVFPNPANDLIRITGITEETEIKIFNLSGDLVFEGEASRDLNINVSRFTPGIYTVLLKNHKTRIARSFLISR
ncbi:MAG: T9SS type A sorting domain-containing protein [Bacteroidetes bacterium]|nr:T9SS type A sorting domain-containing protein [Bacteroidota bacterium]